MRNIDPALQAHLDSRATTLASCWRLTRTDGVALGFTDHDRLLRFDGTDFAPLTGLDSGEAATKLGAGTDTSEVLGVLSADAIDEDDILLGRYDGARVETFRVNWRDVGQRLLLSRTTIGEIVREDGVFRAELRSGQHALNRISGRIYGALCDAELGDARCGVDIDTPEFSAAATVLGARHRFRMAVEGIESFESGWFAHGVAAFASGRREGLRDRVLTHERLGGTDVLGFGVPVGDWVANGDAVTLTVGCDRRFATCRDRFGNMLNFRGFPHIPGNDFVLRYPRAGDALDGRKLVD